MRSAATIGAAAEQDAAHCGAELQSRQLPREAVADAFLVRGVSVALCRPIGPLKHSD